jgi:hypothetical protein
MGEEEETRNCPYCGIPLKHPYWQHVQAEHPEEYARNETWIQLYKDYTSMGMDSAMSLMVIAELFNHSIDDVKGYLADQNIL